MLSVKPVGKQNILELLRAQNILMESPCNGKGLCGKCKIRILSGQVNSLTTQEKTFLTQLEQEKNIRLACLTIPLTEVVLDPLGLLEEKQSVILGDGEMPETMFDPIVTCKTMDTASLHENNGRALCDFVPSSAPLPLSLLQALPEKMADGAAELICYADSPVDLRKDKAAFGFAVDIGTTTVAVTLLDLCNGQKLGEDGFINPQKAFGLDVLSRIHYDMEHPNGVRELQKAIVDRLNQSIDKLTSLSGVPLDAVYELVIGGNSTMLHCLLGVPLASLGKAPYRSVFNRPITVKATELGFLFHPEARIYCIPAVSAYIGGDIVSGALAARLDEATDTVLFLDIGTNGEMILSRKGQMFACSCAAGPALEGMNISCGMRAEPGAIEHVRFTKETVELGVIGQDAPRGLCGSGILEAVSQGVAANIIAKSGRINSDSPFTDIDENGKRRIILDKEHGIYVTQGDIRQVQLCKGAILSGILTLLEQLELKVDQIDRLLVAGQFGKHLNPVSLTGAGLIPPGLETRISYIANSSMTGAKMCLFSRKDRCRAEEIAHKIAYIELSISPGYEKLFAKSIQFGGLS